VSGRYRIDRDGNAGFFVGQIEKQHGKPDEPWVPKDLASYADWHTVIDEVVWLLKVTLSERSDLARHRFRLDWLLQHHLETNVRSLSNVRSSFKPAAVPPRGLVEDDLLRGWYNELAYASPLRASTLGLTFGDVEANKKGAESRLMFPSWRFIQAYYAIYFYVRCLCLMKTSGFRLEQHGATLNTFGNGVLAACERALLPWPVSVYYAPGHRVLRSTLPISQLPHLRYDYARHPRTPCRTPRDSYEYIRTQLRKRARGRGKHSAYTLIDFLYDFRVWANYKDIDGLLALWGPGYRAFIDMDLAVLVFFIGSAAEIAFASAFGEEAYVDQLQHFYDTFVLRDQQLRGQFRSCPLFQRAEVFRGTGLVNSGVTPAVEESPHVVSLRPLTAMP
jgi:hypothetical protein